ncbi:uncharacterized protein LOC125372345 [Haliotis rufescens]|uniref:uncharacterized protein LOC125372345 n=1 Tax=Haliotis rufescens TaxID=6454 RepID=UPI00201EF6F3|nr:uncharacterized protein LOC125372345 [Haliotis rufescens]
MDQLSELKSTNQSTESTLVNDLDQRWDKLKEWSEVKDNLQVALQDPQTFDHSITLEHGPQLFQTMRHCCNIRCSTHLKTKTGETFVSHYRRGTKSYVCVWTPKSQDCHDACVQER